MKMTPTGKYAVLMTEGYDLPDVIVVDSKQEAQDLVEALRREDPEMNTEQTVYYVRVNEIDQREIYYEEEKE